MESHTGNVQRKKEVAMSLRRGAALFMIVAIIAAACAGTSTTPTAQSTPVPTTAGTPAEPTEAPAEPTPAEPTEAPAEPTPAEPTEAPAEPTPAEPTAAPTPELASCGSGATEITWWHITVNEPGHGIWNDLACQFAEENDVTINLTVLENEAFKDKLRIEMQSGNAPDLFQSWGGGVMREQLAAGMVRPIDDEIAGWVDTMNPAAMSIYQVDGVQYGIPYNFGLVGFWYNKDLFAEAGITEPPATWEEFLTAVQALKDAGITPIAVAGQDAWPAMFYWAYLALRIGGQAAMDDAVINANWTNEAIVQAAAELQRLIDLEPFQASFLAATYPDQSASMGNGEVAMELMGQWAPGVQVDNSASGEGIGDALGWFPFPSVDGGVGLPTDLFGGADGFAVGKDAEPEAVEFLEFISSTDVAQMRAELNDGTLPPTLGAEEFVTDPNLQAVLAARAESTFAQLYLDQATTPALGAAINAQVQALLAGQATPEEMTQAIADFAGLELTILRAASRAGRPRAGRSVIVD